ncbi:hypothetical protein PFISCL1PPCAC_13960, partial [Pristionchus fissidentatus]
FLLLLSTPHSTFKHALLRRQVHLLQQLQLRRKLRPVLPCNLPEGRLQVRKRCSLQGSLHYYCPQEVMLQRQVKQLHGLQIANLLSLLSSRDYRRLPYDVNYDWMDE